jgi:hypothetical protein
MDRTQASGAPRLRFFVARSTPNSIRAEQNLQAALAKAETLAAAVELEIIDVFSDPHQALANGVIVTPTLIAMGPRGRATMIGDLADSAELHRFLEALGAPQG